MATAAEGKFALMGGEDAVPDGEESAALAIHGESFVQSMHDGDGVVEIRIWQRVI